MTPAELDALEALERDATPGRWARADVSPWTRQGLHDDRGGEIACLPGERRRDLVFIVALRNAAPDLLRLAKVGAETERLGNSAEGTTMAQLEEIFQHGHDRCEGPCLPYEAGYWALYEAGAKKGRAHAVEDYAPRLRLQFDRSEAAEGRAAKHFAENEQARCQLTSVHWALDAPDLPARVGPDAYGWSPAYEKACELRLRLFQAERQVGQANAFRGGRATTGGPNPLPLNDVACGREGTRAAWAAQVGAECARQGVEMPVRWVECSGGEAISACWWGPEGLGSRAAHIEFDDDGCAAMLLSDRSKAPKVGEPDRYDWMTSCMVVGGDEEDGPAIGLAEAVRRIGAYRRGE